MSVVPQITEDKISALRENMKTRMGEKRYHHTLGVEREIVKLGELYLPQDILRLRAAALLHDLTKELTYAEQIAFCERHHIRLTAWEKSSPKTLHAKTAPTAVMLDYPAFADKIILRAIREHTTGARKMNVFSKLLYLADYIEETRTFPDCMRLRALFWRPMRDLPKNKWRKHLDRTLIVSFDMTISALLDEGDIIAPETIEARNTLVEEINKHI